LAILLLACGALGGACAAATEERQPAVWQTRELNFDYVGFTSRYSCDGLRDRVEQALKTLGARGDLTVTPYPCSTVDRPELLPSLRIKVSTLQPAMAAAEGGTVQARWKTVRLAGANGLGPGDCELAEQIRSRILPLFTTRNLEARTTCVPHQESAGNILLTVDVLVPAAQ